MKIYVINLPRSTKRRKMIESNLNKLGLDFEIFEAVDGRALPKDKLNNYFDKDFLKNKPDYYSPGVAGCTLSHFELYKKITKEKVESALILEDDAIISDDLPEILPQLENQLRRDEIIMLYYQAFCQMKISFSSIVPALNKKYNLYQVNELYGLGSTVCYMISYEAAKRLAEGLYPLSTAADDWPKFFQRNLLNGVRVVYPFIMTHALEPTTINPGLGDKNILKKILNYAESKKVFPIYHILRKRRERCQIGRRNFQIVDETPKDLRKSISESVNSDKT